MGEKHGKYEGGGEIEMFTRVLVRKSEGKRQLARHRHRRQG
jgi:hypothetical protein